MNVFIILTRFVGFVLSPCFYTYGCTRLIGRKMIDATALLKFLLTVCTTDEINDMFDP